MVEAQLMDLTSVCQSFPTLEEPQIRRDNIIEAIETIFSGDTRLVIVEGKDGIGKTTLLAQFVQAHPHHALSLFVSYTSRWAYDPKILRLDLYKQIYWTLFKELPVEENVEDSNLAVMFSKLHERARSKRELYYFVLDGLDEVAREDSHSRSLILDILPFGFNQFRFLVAGDYSQVTEFVSKKLPSKPHQLSGFTPDEAVKYLQDIVNERENIEDLYQLCGRVPGHLASVRRILESGTDVHDILIGDPTRPLHFLELEWSNIDENNDSQLMLLAILAHDRKKRSVTELARILNIEASIVSDSFQSLGFVHVDPKSQEASFISEALRKFAANKLLTLKVRANELLIADLVKQPTSDEALTYLPVLYERTGQHDEILKFLSLDHFTKMLESSQSLLPIQQKAELGVNAARNSGRDSDLMKFSMQKSALTELDISEEWRAEIEARVALNDYEAALTLAQSTLLKEDRLHLLAIVARKKREQGIQLEQELVEQIKQLYSEIDQKALAKRANDIASDLIFSIPELAIELVEKATDTGEGENALDWALASLSVAAMSASDGMSSTGQENSEANENIRARIKDPKARRFTVAASLFFKEFSAAQIIAETEKMEGASDRLYLLRQWAKNNRDRADAVDVIEYALKIAIKTTPYTFNATVLRELGLPLPFISDAAKAHHLIGIFDSQQGTVEPLGPTEDFVRLQLLLARAENNYDFNAARSRISDVYLRVSYIEDLDTKTVCLAWLVTSLASMDPEMKFETEGSDRIHTLAQEEMKSSLEQLLESTGDHYQVTKRVVTALAKYKPELAIEVAMTLNLESRRDAGLLELFESAIQLPVNKINLVFLETALNRFADSDMRDTALISVIERLARETDKLDAIIIQALPFIKRLGQVRSVKEKSRACCLAYTLLMITGDTTHNQLATDLLKLVEDSWQSIDIGWEKIEAGFKIAETLSKYSADKAKEYVERTEKFRDEVSMDVGTTALAYMGCLRLAVRAYSGLLPRNVDTPEDLNRLADLINIVPSSGQRAAFWSDVALRSYLGGRVDQCKRIISERVTPLLQNIPEEDAEYKAQIIIAIAPALYCAHVQTALATISKLSTLERDSSYWGIGNFILRKLPPDEPYESNTEQVYNVTYTEIWDVCDLLQLMETDVVIYHFIKCIAATLVSAKYGDSFNKSQKNDIIRRLRKLVDNKLPDPRNIKHVGYKVAAEAQLTRIENSIRAVNSQVWDNLSRAAEAIPNLADRAYVLSIVASALPAREASKRDQLFEKAKDIISRIPVLYDKVEHYEWLASETAKSNKALSKKCIEEAMRCTIQSDDPEMYPSQRRLLDIAFRQDPNLAASLASVADNDPAKKQTRINLQGQLGVNKMKKKMLEQSSVGQGELSVQDKKNCPTAAWKNLGALNANRIGDIHIEHTREWIQTAAGLSLDQSYPIFAWVIENDIRRLAKTDQARTHVRPIFDAVLQGAALCGQMAARASVIVKRAKGLASKSSDGSSLLVRAGEREEALAFIKEWFTNQVEDYIKICDPYFGPEELQVLQLLQSTKPACIVQILTSRKHNEKLAPSLEEAFRSHWRMSFDQDPPDTRIIVAGNEVNGTLPIHDRWWLTKGGGIRVGTSYNSLGLKKDSEISILSPEEAEFREKEIDQYLELVKREHQGKKLSYTMFTL